MREQIVIATGLGWITRCLGVLAVAIGSMLHWVRAADPGLPMTAGVAWFFIVIGLGLVIATGFESVVETRQRALIKRWRMGFPIPLSNQPLEPYREVLIRSEWSKKGKTTQTPGFSFYPVELRGQKKGLTRLEVYRSNVYEEARVHAVDMARGLNLPLKDRVAKLERTPEELGLTLIQRLQGKVGPPETPVNPPVDSAVQVERDAGTLRLRIPGPTHAGFSTAMSLAPLFLIALLSFPLGPSVVRVFSDLPRYLSTAGIVAGVLVSLGLTISALRSLSVTKFGSEVEVSTAEITVRQRTGLGARRWKISADRVREIDMGEYGVVIRGEGRPVTVGEGRTEPELAWIRDALTETLTASV